MSNTRLVYKPRFCYFCLDFYFLTKDAKYDAPTKLEVGFNGSWAYMCEEHFQEFGSGDPEKRRLKDD